MRRAGYFVMIGLLSVPLPALAQANLPTDSAVHPPAFQGESQLSSIRLSQLHDFHFATWVLLESDSVNKVNRWAETHAGSPDVQQYARDSIAAHDRLTEQLRGPLAAAFQREGATDNEKFDFGAMLQEVGRRLNEPRPVTPTAATPDSAAAPGHASASSTAQTQSPSSADRSRERRIGRRGADPSREERGRRAREAAATLRENLPQLLEELGESMDAADQENENVGLAFIELKRQLGERYAASLISELERGPQGDVDPGYLGIQLVSNLHLIDTMTVAKEHASPELQGLLQQGIEEAGQRVKQARQLMAAEAKGSPDAPPRP